MAAQLAHDVYIVGRAQLDLVSRPIGELAQLDHHVLDRVDADRVVAIGTGVERESPNLPQGTALGFAPQVPGGLVEGALGKAALRQTAIERRPQLGWVGEWMIFDFAAQRFEPGGERAAGGVVIVGFGGFAKSALLMAVQVLVAQLHDERPLHDRRTTRNGERMQEGQIDFVQQHLHRANSQIFSETSSSRARRAHRCFDTPMIQKRGRALNGRMFAILFPLCVAPVHDFQ